MKFLILLFILISSGIQARQQCSNNDKIFSLTKDTDSSYYDKSCISFYDGPFSNHAFYFEHFDSPTCRISPRMPFNLNQDFTMSFWIKFTRLSEQTVFQYNRLFAKITENNFEIWFNDKSIIIPLNAAFYDWNHMTIINENQNQLKLYINAEFAGSFYYYNYEWNEETFIHIGNGYSHFILDGFQIYEGQLTTWEIHCMNTLCAMPCTNTIEYCSQESDFCGVNYGYDPDFENSAKITFIRTYSDQITSPLKWKTEPEKMSSEAIEYGYHYWFKWDYLWRDNYQFDFDYFNQLVELSFLSEYEDSAFESDDYGKRSLCLWLDISQNGSRLLRLGTYDEGYTTDYQQGIAFPQSDFDNQWAYLHYYYSKAEQKVRFAIKFAQQEIFETVSMSDISHAGISADLGKNLYFRLANSHDGHRSPGFQGFYKDVRFTYGAQNSGGYITFDAVRTNFKKLPTPIKALTSGTFHLTLIYFEDYYTNYNFVTDKALYYPKYNLDYPTEYNIHGWFKLPIDFSASEKTVIYRVSTKNTAKSTSRSQNDIGKQTFLAYIQNNVITFESYSIADLHNPQTEGVSVSFTVSQSQIENDLYFYQGYSKEAGVSVVYVKTYDSDTGYLSQLPSNQNNQVIHMRSADYKIYLGGDGESHINLSKISCVKFEYGSGSFIPNVEDNLAYYKTIETCTSEGDKDSYNIGQEYSLESYNNPSYYMSHGSPSYLTDSLEFVGNFELVDGLVGDIDTVSLKSTLEIEGEVRQNFYWRHSSYVIREMENDETDIFAADASFIIHKDAFITGTIALESANKRGFYIRHRGNVIKLDKFVEHEDFYADASWNIVDGAGGHVPSVQLLPVYRLQNPETNDVYLTIHEDKIEAMKSLGYQDYNQPAVGETEEETNIIGYAFNRFWDSYTTAIFEFKDLTTITHYYTTDANDCPEGYTLNIISFYAYPINFERTHPVLQYTDIENETFEWTTSGVEIDETFSDETSYTYVGKKFWIYGSSEDECRQNIDQCGPPIPEECEFAYQYRPNQSSECQECFGEVNHYDHSQGDINKFYTATCTPCEGGQHSWNEDEFGNRTCVVCPFGTLSNDVCYLHCDTTAYKYLNTETMQCTQCDGILEPHPNGIENLYKCVPCDRVDMKRKCSYDGGMDDTSEHVFVIAPNVCPQGTTQVQEFRICSECPLEKDWTLNNDDGMYYCIKTCEDDNHYVNENGQCAPCQNGFIYDDGTGTKKCAPDVKFDPITKAYDDETIEYIYEVPDDQLDDIKEFGFWMWIRPQFLSPKKFDFASATTNDQRIAGFAQIPKQEDADSSAEFGPETKGLAAYVKSHSDPEQEDEKIVVTTFSSDYTTTRSVNRRDYEYEWNLIFVAQQVATGQMCSFLYSPGQSGNKSFLQNDSEIDLSANSLIFYIGRQFYYNSFTNMGFQGQYYNIELRFGYSGIYQNSSSDVQSYLTSQRQPISQIPVQNVVSETYEISSENQPTNLSEVDDVQKTFYMDNLHGTQRYAVYGWFKGSSSRIEKDQILFNLQDISTNQEVTEWGSALKLGDKSLTCYLDSDQTLKFESYSTNAMSDGTYTNTAYTTQSSFSLSQYSNWFYIYLAYDRFEQIAWGYYKNILTQEKYFRKIDVSYDFWHYRTDEQILSLGIWPEQDLDTRYKENFGGEVQNIKLQYHDICEYEDEECVGGFAQEHSPTPAPGGQCVIMYDKINYQGNFISVCDKDESYQMEVLSIYIPEGIEFTIWEQRGFQGLTVVYQLSQSNIQEWNFTLLLEGKVKGAKVMKNAAFYSYLQKQKGEKVFKAFVQDNYNLNSDNSESENQSMLQTGSTTAHSMTQDYDMEQFQNLDSMTSKSSISHTKPSAANTQSTTPAPEVTNVHPTHTDSSSMLLNESKETENKSPKVKVNELEDMPLKENKVKEAPIDISQGTETVEPQNIEKTESNNDDNNKDQQQQDDSTAEAAISTTNDNDDTVVQEKSKKKNKKNNKLEETDQKADEKEKEEKVDDKEIVEVKLKDYHQEQGEEVVPNNGLAKNHLRRN